MDRLRNGNLKWFCITEYVDIETGEILKKTQIQNKEYRITNKTQKNEINKKYGIKRITFECTKHEQIKLEF